MRVHEGWLIQGCLTLPAKLIFALARHRTSALCCRAQSPLLCMQAVKYMQVSPSRSPTCATPMNIPASNSAALQSPSLQVSVLSSQPYDRLCMAAAAGYPLVGIYLRTALALLQSL